MVSVIIATYNWSTALRLAVHSVLGQTLQAFEILVVGDACTDDSEAVVAAFGDARIRWLNLAQNAGSQSGPNNAGL
ncbi:MAG TPA: glycosyltransferase, partial [Roseiarcus sp.]